MSKSKFKKQKYTAKFKRRATKLMTAHLDANVDIISPEIDTHEIVDITSQFIVPHEYYTDTPAWGTTRNHRVSFSILIHPYTACKQLIKQFKGSENSKLLTTLNRELDELRTDLVEKLRLNYGLNINESAIDGYSIVLPFPMGACLLDIYNSRPPIVSQYDDNLTVPTASWMRIIKDQPLLVQQLSDSDDVFYHNINVAARNTNKLKRHVEKLTQSIKLDELRKRFDILYELVDSDGKSITITKEDIDGFVALLVKRLALQALTTLEELAYQTIVLSPYKEVNLTRDEVVNQGDKINAAAMDAAWNDVLSLIVNKYNLTIQSSN